jgi:hypothetical protein
VVTISSVVTISLVVSHHGGVTTSERETDPRLCLSTISRGYAVRTGVGYSEEVVFLLVEVVDFLELVELDFLLEDFVVDFLVLVAVDFLLVVVGGGGGGETLTVLVTLPRLCGSLGKTEAAASASRP